ncbi:hypothetical protein PENCOP_c006G04200 [Penicillium coprophilum]|uniref:2EXR domain-containing protein n=1 Tax=Penicillium coprophilum TaxID=36646 RepID=A0A1V6UNK3_9EURO|nr:hypothetical protein PENCOP_c006G04200 [Penicillium coprophilum]
MQLPAELRRMIWKHCLPYRIAEEDTPDSFFDGYTSKHVCWNLSVTLQNAQKPAISYVNSESRQVALEQGRLLEPARVVFFESLWVQPLRDVLHLSWTRFCFTDLAIDSDAPGPVDEFILQAKDLGMRPSVAADLIHPFSLKGVLDCAGDVDALGSHNSFHFGEYDIAKIRYHCRGEGADDVREMADVLPWAEGQRSRLDIAMAAVSLHLTREAALRSGLFGLLGDAPVQMVDIDDESHLREFQALYQEHALEKEPLVQTLFETFTSSVFKKAVEIWKNNAEWTILAYMWQSARDRKLDILGTDPGSAWVPHLSEQKYIHMDEYLPNEQHLWVKHARQIAPKLRLRIMRHSLSPSAPPRQNRSALAIEDCLIRVNLSITRYWRPLYEISVRDAKPLSPKSFLKTSNNMQCQIIAPGVGMEVFLPSWDDDMSWTSRYDLVDKKGFFDALVAETGIYEFWVTFGDDPLDYTCALPSDIRPGLGNLPCRKIIRKRLDYPMKGPDGNIHVGDPKKLIEASMGNITALRTSLLASYLSVGLSFHDDGPNDTSATDAIVAYSMPILQLTEATSSMKDIKTIGQQAKNDAKKELIKKILTIIFMVIPSVGEALGPLVGSAAAIARIALLVGEAGSAGLTVAEIIEGPTSAPFAMLGLIAGVGGTGRLSKADALAKASKARGLMKAADLAKSPERFRNKDALVQKAVKSLCGRN